MTHRFTLADIAVMTGQAVSGILTPVVKRHASEAGSYMAIAAILIVRTGRNVIWQLTHTDYIVVA